MLDRDKRQIEAIMTLEERILDILAQIENGDISLWLDEIDGENPVYRASNGWRFRVFNDVGDFDYIDAYRPSDGALWEDAPPRVVIQYQPTPEQQMAVWQWNLVRRKTGLAA
jgi:hypothetical protein